MADATIVTAFINLHKYDEEKRYSRPESIYLKDGKNLLQFNLNMVVFVEEEHYQFVYNCRNTLGLMEKTKIVTVNFTDTGDFPMQELKGRIEELRQVKRSDKGISRAARAAVMSSKHSTNHYILMYSKIGLVRKAIELNPFNSAKFAWIDFGISHSADFHSEIYDWIHCIQPKIRLMEINRFRTRESCELARYRHLENADNDTVSSSVMTGDIESLTRFGYLFTEKCQDMLKNGFLFSDKSIISYLIFEHNKTLFDLYFGKKRSVCCNYSRPISLYNTKECDLIGIIVYNAETSLYWDQQGHALDIIKYVSPIFCNEFITKTSMVEKFIRTYLLSKWYVEPRGYLDYYMIEYLSRMLRSEKYKEIAYIIKNMKGYIDCYLNKNDLISLIDAL